MNKIKLYVIGQYNCMSRYTPPPLIPGALYEFRSKPTKDSGNVTMLPDGYVTMINEFVREEDSQYVFITKRLTLGGTEISNNDNDTTEIKYNKAQLSEVFFVLEYRGGSKRTSYKRRHKKSRSKKSRKNN